MPNGPLGFSCYFPITQQLRCIQYQYSRWFDMNICIKGPQIQFRPRPLRSQDRASNGASANNKVSCGRQPSSVVVQAMWAEPRGLAAALDRSRAERWTTDRAKKTSAGSGYDRWVRSRCGDKKYKFSVETFSNSRFLWVYSPSHLHRL